MALFDEGPLDLVLLYIYFPGVSKVVWPRLSPK